MICFDKVNSEHTSIESRCTWNVSPMFDPSVHYQFLDLSAGSIQPACHSLGTQCDSQPCMNSGLCSEGWNRFVCDCAATSFAGPTCGKGRSLLRTLDERRCLRVKRKFCFELNGFCCLFANTFYFKIFVTFLTVLVLFLSAVNKLLCFFIIKSSVN